MLFRNDFTYPTGKVGHMPVELSEVLRSQNSLTNTQLRLVIFHLNMRVPEAGEDIVDGQGIFVNKNQA